MIKAVGFLAGEREHLPRARGVKFLMDSMGSSFLGSSIFGAAFFPAFQNFLNQFMA